MDYANYSVRFVEYIPDHAERAAADDWVAANDLTGVADVEVAPEIVSVSGNKDQFNSVTGTCARTGHLTADLNIALANLRRELA